MKITQSHSSFDVQIFVTGMHMDEQYGSTVNEVYKSGFQNIHTFRNYEKAEHMDRTLAKTITGFSDFVTQQNPDLIVVHGDRVEALAGAIVGSLNNVLVAHVEGGEISGTVDELIRHSVSKLSHIHLVSNDLAKKRLVQMGELESSVYIIGSPDLDLMNPKKLPELSFVKEYYEIPFDAYAIAMYHPVTTEYNSIKKYIKNFVDALIASEKNYVLIYPNNDLGTHEILEEYKRLKENERFKIYPSLRFEYFLTLLKESDFVIGNSSAGVREAPYYQIPTIDVGTRQHNRSQAQTIINVSHEVSDILNGIQKSSEQKHEEIDFSEFGMGNSDQIFLDLLLSDDIWNVNCQKQFQDLE
jgi:UDP-N-acetylglucosamine 2-epimerase (hydrolysing)